MNMAGCAALAALFIIVGPAFAESASVSGSLSTPEQLRIAPASSGSARADAAFWPNATGMRELTVTSARIHVDIYEFDRVDVPLTKQYVLNHSRSIDLDTANVALAAEPTTGWVAYYGDPTGSAINLTTTAVSLEPTTKTIGNTPDATAGQPGSPLPLYNYVPSSAYILAVGAMNISRTGSATIKLFGPSIRVVGSGTDTTYWTGTRPSENTPGAVTDRWIVISTQDGRLSAASDLDAELATSAAILHVTGEVSATKASGALESESGSYVAIGQDAIVTGDLQADLRSAGSQSKPTIEATINGALTSTTLGFARAPVTPTSSGSFWLLGAIGVFGFAIAAIAARQVYSHRRPRLTPEQLADLAYTAADADRFGEALEWIQNARRLAPRSERLRLDEASFLSRLGDHAAALALYDELAATSSTGEADFHAAALSAELGQPLDSIRPRIVRALARTPFLALEIADDEAFSDVKHDPQVARAISAALRKLDSGREEFE